MITNSTTDNQGSISSPQVFEKIVNFFTEVEWPFFVIEGQRTLRLNYRGNNGRFTCSAQFLEERNYFMFYSFSPVSVPEHKRLIVAEFLTRANYRLIFGNFEMDFTDGEVYYRTSLNVEGINLDSARISHVVYTNVSMMDRYLPGIMQVIYSNVSAADAIAQIEGYNQLTHESN
jgi:hypothetical protein